MYNKIKSKTQDNITYNDDDDEDYDFPKHGVSKHLET